MKVALFGAGRIGRIHAANLAALPGVTLAVVSDPVAAAAQEVAAQFGARVAPSIDAVFADHDIDAVVICSPTTTHSDLITRAATARKHIFCEKPVDLSVARAKSCADAVASAGVGCMIGFQRRFDPTFNEAKRRLDQGQIGTLEMLVITSRDPGAPPVDYIRQSGGIFRDMLIHDFDVFRWILTSGGEDEAVWLCATASCLTDTAIAAAGDMDTTAVTIRTRSGRLCQINTSRRAAYGYDQRFEVLGSAGMLSCHNHRPTEVTLSNGAGIGSDGPEKFFLQRYREAYRLEIAHFFERLQSGQRMATSIEDGVKAQRLADAAACSFESGQPVSLTG